MGVLVILDWCPGDILMVSWRYLMGVFYIFCRCTRDFFVYVLEISYGCRVDI